MHGDQGGVSLYINCNENNTVFCLVSSLCCFNLKCETVTLMALMRILNKLWPDKQKIVLVKNISDSVSHNK